MDKPGVVDEARYEYRSLYRTRLRRHRKFSFVRSSAGGIVDTFGTVVLI